MKRGGPPKDVDLVGRSERLTVIGFSLPMLILGPFVGPLLGINPLDAIFLVGLPLAVLTAAIAWGVLRLSDGAFAGLVHPSGDGLSEGARLSRVETMIIRGRVQEARVELERLWAVDPTDWGVGYRMAELAAHSGDFERRPPRGSPARPGSIRSPPRPDSRCCVI